MEIAADDGPVHYEFTYWAAPLPNVKDWRKAYDWPTEGENFLVWVRYKATNTSDKAAPAKVEIKLDPNAVLPGVPQAPQEPAADRSFYGSHSVSRELPPGASIEGACAFPVFRRERCRGL